MGTHGIHIAIVQSSTELHIGTCTSMELTSYTPQHYNCSANTSVNSVFCILIITVQKAEVFGHASSSYSKEGVAVGLTAYAPLSDAARRIAVRVVAAFAAMPSIELLLVPWETRNTKSKILRLRNSTYRSFLLENYINNQHN